MGSHVTSVPSLIDTRVAFRPAGLRQGDPVAEDQGTNAHERGRPRRWALGCDLVALTPPPVARTAAEGALLVSPGHR